MKMPFSRYVHYLRKDVITCGHKQPAGSFSLAHIPRTAKSAQRESGDEVLRKIGSQCV